MNEISIFCLGDRQKFTVEQAAAQAFLFFVAGFDTSSATMQFTLYELALQPDIQQKVQAEIDESRNSNGGEITYEGLMQMNYLDRILSGTTSLSFQLSTSKFLIGLKNDC